MVVVHGYSGSLTARKCPVCMLSSSSLYGKIVVKKNHGKNAQVHINYLENSIITIYLLYSLMFQNDYVNRI